MQLSRFDYYSDYVAYPILIVVLTVVSLAAGGRHELAAWGAALVAGCAFWSLAEYWIHRIVLHRMPYFSRLHAAHHGAPLALIGTPTWISMLTLGVVILAPAWALLGFATGSALFIGVSGGYVWYGAVHHVIHHGGAVFGPNPLPSARSRHLKHHFRPQQGNFGVTTPLWDHVFGTALAPAGARPAPVRH